MVRMHPSSLARTSEEGHGVFPALYRRHALLECIIDPHPSVRRLRILVPLGMVQHSWGLFTPLAMPYARNDRAQASRY